MTWLFGHEAYGILASQTRIKSVSPCVGKHSLNHWATREVPLLADTLNKDDRRWKVYLEKRFKELNVNLERKESGRRLGKMF